MSLLNLGELINLMELLSSFSCHNSEVKSILRFLELSASKRHVVWSSMLSSLRKVTIPSDGPDDFFYFGGNPNGGILLPAITKFPASGYGFCCWFRVESFNHSRIPQYYPHLFRFVFERSNLIIELLIYFDFVVLK